MAEKKKKQKRIKGRHYWALQTKIEELKKVQEDLEEWANKQAEKMELYPDQINWSVGSIFDPMVEIVEGNVINGKVIQRLDRSIFKEYNEKQDKIKLLNKDLLDYRKTLVKKLGIWIDLLNIKTGEISPNEYDGVDPDTVEKIREEKETTDEEEDEEEVVEDGESKQEEQEIEEEEE